MSSSRSSSSGRSVRSNLPGVSTVSARLVPALVERVLERLGLDGPPPATPGGLDRLYLAWSRTVPFDNVRKRIALASGSPDPLPGAQPDDFFEAFLRHGTGGTCWPTSGALHALLVACGFPARRATGAMAYLEFGIAESHATVIVTLDDGVDRLVDSSMLTERAIPFRDDAPAEHPHPLHPVRSEPADGAVRFWFKTGTTADREVPCLLLQRDVSHDHYLARYGASRESGPFNDVLHARRHFVDHVVTIRGDTRYERHADGVRATPLDDRRRVLVEEMGLSPEIVERIPRDGALG